MKFTQPDPKAGDILLAEPLMADESFQRAVIVLVEHNPKAGSMGFVINRQSNHLLNDLVAEIVTDEEIPVYIGGPVHQNRLYYVHVLGALVPDSINIGGGLYVSGDFKAMIEYVNSGSPVNGMVRFFLGYSGWEISQLRKELDNYDWAVKRMTDARRLLTLDEEHLWRAEVADLDERYRLWLNCPTSVIMN